tara:strand:- start:771 stop:908 length:138 start_codon:yes stop_codon:yes gene_type:complete
MGLNYRKAMTPGMKMCKDYYEGGKKKENKKETIKDVPPQIYKVKK